MGNMEAEFRPDCLLMPGFSSRKSVRPEFRKSGLDYLLYRDLIEQYPDKSNPDYHLIKFIVADFGLGKGFSQFKGIVLIL